MKNNNFYITTTLPYINARPHIGFAKEIIKADIIARYQRLNDNMVFFNTGTDEHGSKIWQKAQESNVAIEEYCKQQANYFKLLKDSLNLSYTNFIRTTDAEHIKAAQEFWQRCYDNGDIYKKNYKLKYCVGCELEKTDSDLVNNRCPFHPNTDLEIIDEENYFFRFSKYQTELLNYYEKNKDFVYPLHRFKEIINFVKQGLNDFSISRLKSKMPHGIAVPNDSDQVMYVWFDALINYISTLGWPNNLENFKQYWPGLQVCGKDNLRQQTAMWPAMLLSAKLPLPKKVLIFGFLTIDGQKISKSLGNVIDPVKLSEQYKADTIRYYLSSEVPTYEDGDFSLTRLEEKYNSDLANVLGNLAARLTNLCAKYGLNYENSSNFKSPNEKLFNDYHNLMEQFLLKESLELLFKNLRQIDEDLSRETPWKMTDEKLRNELIKKLTSQYYQIALLLEPFLPETSQTIQKHFAGEVVEKISILFPKLNN